MHECHCRGVTKLKAASKSTSIQLGRVEFLMDRAVGEMQRRRLGLLLNARQTRK